MLLLLLLLPKTATEAQILSSIRPTLFQHTTSPFVPGASRTSAKSAA